VACEGRKGVGVGRRKLQRSRLASQRSGFPRQKSKRATGQSISTTSSASPGPPASFPSPPGSHRPQELSLHPSPAPPATSTSCALASQRTQPDRAVGKEGGGRPEQGEARAPPLSLSGCVLPSPPWRGDSYFFRPPSFFLASPSLGLFV
jgi:hypothetical protein